MPANKTPTKIVDSKSFVFDVPGSYPSVTQQEKEEANETSDRSLIRVPGAEEPPPLPEATLAMQDISCWQNLSDKMHESWTDFKKCCCADKRVIGWQGDLVHQPEKVVGGVTYYPPAILKFFKHEHLLLSCYWSDSYYPNDNYLFNRPLRVLLFLAYTLFNVLVSLVVSFLFFNSFVSSGDGNEPVSQCQDLTDCFQECKTIFGSSTTSVSVYDTSVSTGLVQRCAQASYPFFFLAAKTFIFPNATLLSSSSKCYQPTRLDSPCIPYCTKPAQSVIRLEAGQTAPAPGLSNATLATSGSLSVDPRQPCSSMDSRLWTQLLCFHPSSKEGCTTKLSTELYLALRVLFSVIIVLPSGFLLKRIIRFSVNQKQFECCRKLLGYPLLLVFFACIAVAMFLLIKTELQQRENGMLSLFTTFITSYCISLATDFLKLTALFYCYYTHMLLAQYDHLVTDKGTGHEFEKRIELKQSKKERKELLESGITPEALALRDHKENKEKERLKEKALAGYAVEVDEKGRAVALAVTEETAQGIEKTKSRLQRKRRSSLPLTQSEMIAVKKNEKHMGTETISKRNKRNAKLRQKTNAVVPTLYAGEVHTKSEAADRIEELAQAQSGKGSKKGGGGGGVSSPTKSGGNGGGGGGKGAKGVNMFSTVQNMDFSLSARPQKGSDEEEEGGETDEEKKKKGKKKVAQSAQFDYTRKRRSSLPQAVRFAVPLGKKEKVILKNPGQHQPTPGLQDSNWVPTDFEGIPVNPRRLQVEVESDSSDIFESDDEDGDVFDGDTIQNIVKAFEEDSKRLSLGLSRMSLTANNNTKPTPTAAANANAQKMTPRNKFLSKDNPSGPDGQGGADERGWKDPHQIPKNRNKVLQVELSAPVTITPRNKTQQMKEEEEEEEKEAKAERRVELLNRPGKYEQGQAHDIVSILEQKNVDFKRREQEKRKREEEERSRRESEAQGQKPEQRGASSLPPINNKVNSK